LTTPSRKTPRRAAALLAACVLAFSGAVASAQNAPPPNQLQQPAAQPADTDAPADAPTPQGERVTKAEEISFLKLLLMGGWFMVPIALCSLLGLAISFERLIGLRRGAIIPPGFMQGLAGVFQKPHEDQEKALKYCHAHPSPLSRLVAVGIRKMPQGEEAVEQAIEDAGGNEVFKLRRNLRMLYGITAIAPMIGLLGTVWGMIEAFRVASAKGLGGEAAQQMAGGIYEALVTTFAGLCVAIPLLVFYYFFVGRIERLVSELNDVSEQFIERYMQGDPPPSRRASAPVMELSDEDIAPVRPVPTA
jgi:biopolymer transport protein ExbB